MIDGAALLRTILANPGKPVVLSHDQGVAIARDLAAAQAPAIRQDRMVAAIAGLARSDAAAA